VSLLLEVIISIGNPMFLARFTLPLVVSALLSFFGATAVFSEEPSKGQSHASLTIVNAVPGDHNVNVIFDEVSIWPPGFTSGQATAAVFFPAGRKQVKLQCEGYAENKGALELPANANCAFVLYPGELVGEGDDKGKRKINMFVLPSHKAGTKETIGTRWKIVLLGSSSAEEVEVNGARMLLTPRKVVDVPAKGDRLTMKYRGEDIFGSAPEDSGDYWVVVFPSEGELQAVLLNHSPLKIPPM
jgi:hypothetical protein